MQSFICNLIVPGFPKSGSSSFHNYLAQHPALCMSEPKEPHFFSIDDEWKKGVAHHNSLFRGRTAAASYYGESTTTYCICPDAIKRIAANLKGPKIIILMREPVTRLLSHYRWMYKLGLESELLMDALKGSEGGFHPDRRFMGCYKSYLEFSSYSKFVPLWANEFGDQNVLLISTESLRNDPVRIMNKCFHFLNLCPISNIHLVEDNITENIRVIGSRRFSNRFSEKIPREYKGMLSKIPFLKTAWRRISSGENREPRQISDSELGELETLLKKETYYYNEVFGATSA